MRKTWTNKLSEWQRSSIQFSVVASKNLARTISNYWASAHCMAPSLSILDHDFDNADSEIETVARECIAGDFATIAQAYGYEGYDVEELIATRDW
ncbi:DUF5713 family protein [Jonesiaceae bacterium BS-20]|uniref:DUF5713 family protein n=1 Tax=Jonesiaceae bacterium BS-20 TaxID=3120821 RepID=A0AAU7DU67_9MICO